MKWIRVEDLLPPYGERVLVQTKLGHIDISRLMETESHGANWSTEADYPVFYDPGDVTHWMRLPEKHV